MNEVALWTVALATAVIGFLLLATAGVAAAILKSRRSADRDRDDAVSTELPGQQQISSYSDEPAKEEAPASSKGGGIWVWLQACILASLHALVVSVVLGVMTFYEDIVQSHEEISRTGRVSFPKSLLPGSVATPARHRLSRPEEDYSRYEAADDGFAGLGYGEDTVPGVTDWDVIALHEDVGER